MRATARFLFSINTARGQPADRPLIGASRATLLPACALRRVTSEPAESWRRRVSWADVIADPIGAVTAQYGGDERNLATLAKLNPAYADRDAVSMRFDRNAIAAAEKLGAAHVSEHGHSAIIVGQDVADQLVADHLKRALKDERARARARRDDASANAPGGEDGATETPEQAHRPAHRQHLHRCQPPH